MNITSTLRKSARHVKGSFNQALGRLGYRLVRVDTLDRLTAEHAQAAAFAAKPAPAPARDGPKPPDAMLKLLPSANKAPPSCTALAPKFDPVKTPSQLADNIVAFQQGGITVISTSAAKAASWRETERFDRDVGNLHSAWDWAGNSVESYTDDLQAGIPSPALVDDLRTLFSGGDFEAFFRGVLGCPAKVANVRLVRSLPHVTDGVGPQEWHRDGCPAGVIRGVLYLCDVGQQTGPFQYKDEAGGEHTVLGKTGDLLIFDAMRLLHRGLPPTHDARSAIDLVFMPRMPDEEMKIMMVGMNHWPADPFFYKIPAERVPNRDLR
jgi:hypothetical protein